MCIKIISKTTDCKPGQNLCRGRTLDSVHAVHALLDLGNTLAWVQTLGADLGAVHDSLALVQLEGIIQIVQPFLCEVVTAVNDPPGY